MVNVNNTIKRIANAPRKCLIYTLSGVKSGTAQGGFMLADSREVAKVKSLDGKVSFYINQSTFDHKYFGEDTPTFYNC